MKNKSRCEYGKHDVRSTDVFIYTDLPNGAANDTPICRACYKRHILKYYPDSRVAENLRQETK